MITRPVINASTYSVVEGTDTKDEFVFITATTITGYPNEKFITVLMMTQCTCSVIEMAEAFAKAKARVQAQEDRVFMTVSGEKKLWEWVLQRSPRVSAGETSVDLNIAWWAIDTDWVGRLLNYIYVIGT